MENAQAGTPRKGGRIGRARTVVRLAVLAAIIVGLGVHMGWGTYSSMGIDFVATICPLGALESLAGSMAFVPRLIVAFLAMVVIIFFLGRAFCSWVCPVPPLSRFFSSKKTRSRIARECNEAGAASLARAQQRRALQAAGKNEVKAAEGTAAEPPIASHAASSSANGGNGSVEFAKPRFDSRMGVLLAAVGSAAVFGFPVFCLICPIGLTCATMVLLMRLMGVGELSWGLLVFPLIVIVELVFLRDFCSKFCPVSALMSLIARGNRTVRPRADKATCLRRTEGKACHACASACPQHIDPHSNLGDVSVVECTRCGRCVDACPVEAVKFHLIDTASKA